MTRLLLAAVCTSLLLSDECALHMPVQTLCCTTSVDDGLLQVTPADVRLVDAGTGALVHQWKAPAGLQINTASASPSQVKSSILSAHFAVQLRWVLSW